PGATLPRQGGLRAGLRPDPPLAGPEYAASGGPGRRAGRRGAAGEAGGGAGPAPRARRVEGVRSRRRAGGAVGGDRGMEALAGRLSGQPVSRVLLAALLLAGALEAWGSGGEAAQKPAQVAAGTARPPSVFVSYSFDDDVATGPDTFAIYRYGKGHVRLSQAFHVSGYRSVEIRDVKGDGAFPELQGYFPLQDRGRLFFPFPFPPAPP